MKKILIVISLLSMLLAFTACGDNPSSGNQEEETEAPESISVQEQLQGATPGDTIEFGNYQNLPIEWIYVGNDSDNAVLLSKRIIDNKCFNTNGEYAIWNASSLRIWLNDEFFNEAFDEEGQSYIATTEVVTKLNGEISKDKVFLLSADEFLSWLDATMVKAECTEPAYQYAMDNLHNDCYTLYNNQDGEDMCGEYLLRDHANGYKKGREVGAATVSPSGELVGAGSASFAASGRVDCEYGVRPVIEIKMGN